MQEPPRRRADDRDVGLQDVFRILWRRKVWIAAGTIVALLAGAGLALSLAEQWEGQALVQMGQTPVSSDNESMRLVESPERAVQRIKLGSFQDVVLGELGWARKTPNARLYVDSFKVQTIPGTDLVDLRVRARSAAEARKILEANVRVLSAVHQELAEPSLKRVRTELHEAQNALRAAAEERDRIADAYKQGSAKPAGSSFSERVLLASLLDAKERQIKHLGKELAIIQTVLSPARAYPTSLVNRVFVPDRPASPRRLSIVALCGVLGLVASVFLAFVVHYVQTQPNPAVRKA